MYVNIFSTLSGKILDKNQYNNIVHNYDSQQLEEITNIADSDNLLNYFINI